MAENPVIEMFKYTWKYSKGRRHVLLFFWSLSFMAGVLLLLQPLVLARVFNAVQFNTGQQMLHKVFTNLALFFGLTVVALALHHTSRIIELNHAFIISKNYRRTMFEKVLYLPLRWHKEHHSGDTIDRVGNAASALGSFAGSTFNVIQAVVRIVGSLIILFIFDWTSSLIALAAALLTFAVLLRFDKVLVKLYRSVMRFENYLAAGIQDYLSNIKTVVTLRLRPRVVREIEERTMLSYPDSKRSNTLGELKWAFLSFTVPLATVIVLGIYAYRSYSMAGVIVVGSLYALYSYLNNVASTFFNFAGNYGFIMRQHASMEAAEDINNDYERLGKPRQETPPERWEHITIRNLTFAYDEEKGVSAVKVKGIDMELHRGQRIALIGESGSGKSTVLALLRGLYEPQKAEVQIDGRRMDAGLLGIYGTVTLIPQDPEIFNTTIEDNVTMGIPSSPQRVKEVLALARFTPVLERLENGLLTNVQEKGVNLSGGEKQRLALARGLLAAAESDILLLDEPTSSVDSTNELAIYRSIFSEFTDKTIVASVHRLHLLPHFDYVYYLDKGKIIAEGSYSEMKKDPRFRRLLANTKKK